MILSYANPFDDDNRPQTIEAEITTDHPSSSYGIPVIVLPDGGALDATSWVLLRYAVISATEQEYILLRAWLSNLALLISGGRTHLMIIDAALDLATERGYTVSGRTLRWAAANGYIPGAGRVGRDWLIPRDALLAYLANRPKPGRRKNHPTG